MLFIIIVLLRLFANRVSGTQVHETSLEFQCTEGLSQYDVAVDFPAKETRCEEVWTLNGKTFATYTDGEVECHEPCVSLHSGNVSLSTCVNVTLTFLCSSQFLQEKRVHFTGRTVHHESTTVKPPVPPHQKWLKNHFGLLGVAALMLSVAAGVLLWKKFCGKGPGASAGELVSPI